MKEKRKVLLRIALSILVLFFFYLPIYDALKTSLTPFSDILKSPPNILPQPFTFQEYIVIFTTPKWINSFAVTALYSVTSVLIVLFVSGLAAYGLSRYKFRGKATYMFTILTTDIISFGFLMIPLMFIFQFLGLYDSYLGMILVTASSLIPFGVWTLRGFLDQIPVDMEEAGIIDGASTLQVLYHILIPVSISGFISTGTLVFIAAWSGGFLSSLLLTRNETYFPVVRSIFELWFSARTGGALPLLPYNRIMAASLLAALPPMAIYVVLQKKIVKGLTAGALK